MTRGVVCRFAARHRAIVPPRRVEPTAGTRFLQLAAGSAELHYHVRFATDAALIPRPVGDTLLAEITRMRKMLFLLLRRVREATPHSGHTPTTHNPRPEASHREPRIDDN